LSQAVLVVRGRVAERVREEAEKLGMTSEEYLLEIITRDLDPKDRAVEYVEAAAELLEQAQEELSKGNVRQSAEKVWGAAALAVKAYAYWRDGRRLTSRAELWEYKRKLLKEVGKWVHNSWASATEMHVCFYEGWCAKEDVEHALEHVEKLVKEVTSKIKG